MGLYSRWIFPRICDLTLGQAAVVRQRAELLADVDGRVLEIGFGTGLNLAHYPEHIREITTVDPSIGMQRIAQRRISRARIKVHQQLASSEELPCDNGAFDCVVSTFTLCSIALVDKALAEIVRVLKPGGRFFFLEHGLSPAPRVQKWQRRLNGLQMRLADGCRLDRNMRQLVQAQPFSSVSIDEFYLDRVPPTHGYVYRGVASR